MGWVWHQVWHQVWHTNPPAVGGRSRPYVSLREGSPARARAGRSATPSGPIRDALLCAFLVIGDISAACAWTWPSVFPKADPMAVLVRYHTPNVYAAVVAWYDVAPGVAVFLTGRFLISPSRIWCARMGVSFGLRSRLPAWPLSPTADGPAIVVGEVHPPVRAIEIPAPEWLTIPECGLSTGVAMFGAVGSGKTSACLHPFARQLLSWHADNPERRPAALVLEVKGDLCHDIRRMLRTAVLSGAGGSSHRGRSQLMSPLTNPGRFTTAQAVRRGCVRGAVAAHWPTLKPVTTDSVDE